MKIPPEQLAKLKAWALQQMTHPPTWIIGSEGRTPNMQWWWIMRNGDNIIGRKFDQPEWLMPFDNNVFIHTIFATDNMAHNHPWSTISIMLEGSLIDHWIAKDGTEHKRLVTEGEVFYRSAPTVHWIEQEPGKHALTIFITGKYKLDWHFMLNGQEIPWKNLYNQANDTKTK